MNHTYLVLAVLIRNHGNLSSCDLEQSTVVRDYSKLPLTRIVSTTQSLLIFSESHILYCSATSNPRISSALCRHTCRSLGLPSHVISAQLACFCDRFFLVWTTYSDNMTLHNGYMLLTGQASHFKRVCRNVAKE